MDYFVSDDCSHEWGIWYVWDDIRLKIGVPRDLSNRSYIRFCSICQGVQKRKEIEEC